MSPAFSEKKKRRSFHSRLINTKAFLEPSIECNEEQNSGFLTLAFAEPLPQSPDLNVYNSNCSPQGFPVNEKSEEVKSKLRSPENEVI